MIELRVLGALDLRSNEGAEILSVLSQPKRTALLCYLAFATPRGFHRKDKLLVLFWPEHDQEHARAALRQAVYFLRRSIGEEAILSRGDDELAVADAALWCDAVAFENAMAEGRPDEALDLYRGDLLQGFFVEDAPDFERWLDTERERLRARAAQAAWALAERAEVAQDAATAATWGKQALAYSPADETVARRLMSLLERLGDRAAALRAYEAFAWKLEQELGVTPSVETRALAEAIRQREHPPASALPAAVASAAVAAARPFEAVAGQAAAAAPAQASPPSAAPAFRPRSVPPLTRLLARLSHVFRTAQPPDRSVAVLPFANFSPNPGDAYLGDALSDEIIGSLAKIQGLRVAARTSSFVFRDGGVDVRDIGRHLNVGAILEGSIQRVGNLLRVTTQLIDARDGFHLWSANWNAEMDDVFRIEEEISANVARVLPGMLPQARGPVRIAPRAPAVPRTSVPAYEAYLRGRQYFFQTRLRSLRYAREMFERAIEADPDYALAHAALADTVALENMYYPASSADLPAAEAASARALQLAPELGETHSARGNVLFMAGRHAEAEAEYREAIRRDPSLFEPRYFCARMCFQDGRLEDATRLFQEACKVREDYQAPFFAAQ
ncbi:MAG TPA: BTAD domain-containing putative transcriptional regulator, partial [Longimicrobiales bacterium]